MSHVLSSEMGKESQFLMRLLECDDGLMFQVRWRVLLPAEETEEPSQKVHEDVPDQVKNLSRKITPEDLSIIESLKLSL